MDDQLVAFLDGLHRRGREHDADKEDRLDRLRNVEPDTAKLLAVLSRSIRPARILELGTSNGYSTVWLADAARATGAELVSVEIDPARTQEARENLEAAGLGSYAELRTEDAAATLAASPDDHWGLIFLDVERPAYTGYWRDLVRTLTRSGLLVVDNVISHAEQVADFRQLVAEDPQALDVLAPTGAGALLVVKAPAALPSPRGR
jgi:predicted O-methyltransferase YrrM